MAETFGSQYMRLKGKPIDCEGSKVHAHYRRIVKGKLELRLNWVQVANELSQSIEVQGVEISTKGGKLRVADLIGSRIVLWSDTAPPAVVLTTEGRVRELFIWNCWRREDGSTDALIGNGGMRIDKREGGTLRFRCNSRPIITFEDLIFDVEFVRI